MSTATESLLADFAASQDYRAGFVVAHAKQSIPLQIHDLMEQHGLKQAQLARLADISQSTVSRALDPGYGDLNINTLVRIAAGFDVAFVCGFVPFSRFFEWLDQTMGITRIPKFSDEFPEGQASASRHEDFREALNAAQQEAVRLRAVETAGKGQRSFDFMRDRGRHGDTKAIDVTPSDRGRRKQLADAA
jgi:predicted XRE-type DNA-binding protein